MGKNNVLKWIPLLSRRRAFSPRSEKLGNVSLARSYSADTDIPSWPLLFGDKRKAWVAVVGRILLKTTVFYFSHSFSSIVECSVKPIW